jgi:hypothetical protein
MNRRQLGTLRAGCHDEADSYRVPSFMRKLNQEVIRHPL